jgi:DNA-binding NarL/FixJ family response regulator
MQWPTLTRLPSLLFGAPGSTADVGGWSGTEAEDRTIVSRRQAIALVDDDAAFRKKLGRRGLSSVVCYKAAMPLLDSARQAASLSGSAPWSAIVISAGLADMSGITAMARIKTLFPKLPVWLVLPLEEPHSLLAAICAGADGYLLKQADGDSLRSSLASLPGAEPPFSGRLAVLLYSLLTRNTGESTSSGAQQGFSATQISFIRMTAERGSTTEAARAMGLDAAHRERMLQSIYRQLRNRITSAAILASMRLNHQAIH